MLDIRFPEKLLIKAKGGPEFLTNIEMAKSGYEYRSSQWPQPRIRYIINYATNSINQIEELISIFRLCQGRALAFKFKDPIDYYSPKTLLGYGDGKKKEFKLKKNYYYNNVQMMRHSLFALPETIKLYLNDVRVDEYASSDNGSTITFPHPPDQGAEVAAEFEFDILGRFDSDFLPISFKQYRYKIENLAIVEDRRIV